MAAPAIVRVASIMPVKPAVDHDALYRLMQERMHRVWCDLMYGDGTSDMRGGLADLIRQTPSKPDAIIVGNQTWRTYQRYSGYTVLPA